jgi:hypothetical protein
MLTKRLNSRERSKRITFSYFSKNNCKGFGFGERNGIYKNNNFVPGPGAYHSQSNLNEYRNIQELSSSTTFGKSPRGFNISTCPLGPG